jgi:hypothetical protein
MPTLTLRRVCSATPQAMTLARQYAIKAVKAQMREQGLRPNYRLACAAAFDYLATHPELIQRASEAIQKWSAQRATKRPTMPRAPNGPVPHTAIDPFSNR